MKRLIVVIAAAVSVALAAQGSAGALASPNRRPQEPATPLFRTPQRVTPLFGTPQRVLGVGTSVGPSLAEFNGRLHMVWKGAGGDQAIWWNTFDGTTWTGQQMVPNVTTTLWATSGPSLAVFHGRLYMAWIGGFLEQILFEFNRCQ